MAFEYRKSEYAFSTWTLVDLPLQDALLTLHRHGFDHVEIWASVQHLDPRLKADVGQVKQWLKQNGQSVHSLHAPILHPFPHPKEESAFRAYRMNLHRQTLDACARLEAPIMVLHTYDAHEYPYQNAQADILRDCLGALIEYAAPRGVRIAVENMPDRVRGDEVVTTLENQRRLFGDLDVYYCLDIGHVPVMGQTTCEAEIDAAADRLVTFHVHNNHGLTDEHNLPDEGVLDWPAIHAYARKKEYKGEFVLELRGDQAGGEETVRRAAALFQKAGSKLC